MKRIIRIIFLTLPLISFSQMDLNKFPDEIHHLDFGAETQAAWDSQREILESGKPWNDFTQEEKAILEKYPETMDMWSPVSGGCSWYCGGGPKRVEASSFLASQGSVSYKPENAHDLNYKNACVEGVKGYGIGETLNYFFPREVLSLLK